MDAATYRRIMMRWRRWRCRVFGHKRWKVTGDGRLIERMGKMIFKDGKPVFLTWECHRCGKEQENVTMSMLRPKD
jgi:hypothetical protein